MKNKYIQRGSQIRQKIEDTDFVLVSLDKGSAILQDKTSGEKELWIENDDFAGYVIDINGKGYEFVRSL